MKKQEFNEQKQLFNEANYIKRLINLSKVDIVYKKRISLAFRGLENKLIKLVMKNEKNFNSQELVLTPDNKRSLYITLATLLNPGDQVIIVGPCRYEDIDTLESLGLSYSVQNYQDLLIDNNTKAIVVSNPNRVTGQLYENYLKLFTDDIYLISDERFALINHSSKLPLSKLLNQKENFICLKNIDNSLGYITSSKTIITMIKANLNRYHQSISYFQFRTALKVWKKRVKTQALAYSRLRYAQKLCKKYQIEYLDIDGGYFITLIVSQDSFKLALKLLREANILVLPSQAEGTLKLQLNYANKKRHLKKAIEAIAFS